MHFNYASCIFARSLFSFVWSHVNYQKYQEKGTKLFAEAHIQALSDKQLFSCFKPGIGQVPHSSSEVDKFAEETVVCSVYNAIVVKMLIIIS